MKIRLSRLLGLSLSPVLLMSIALGCRFLTMEQEKETVISDRTYSMDTSTVLQSLSQGSSNVFTLQTENPKPIPALPVRWSQADYLFIAQSFHTFIWDESIENWKLKEMLFRLNCEDASLGPQFASFDFFKIVQIREQSSRLVRKLYINPGENRVDLLEVEYSPDLVDWPSIDMEHVKVTAEQALRIAESNGGINIRQSIEDKCIIYEHFEAGGTYSGVFAYNGWVISYSSNENAKTLIRMNIDGISGEYKIIR